MDIDNGRFEIELGDETVVLEPTLKALQRIDRHFGSIRTAAQRCSDLSLDAVVSVIAAGSDADVKKLPEKVYRQGLINVAPKLTDYLLALMNPTGEQGDGSGKA